MIQLRHRAMHVSLNERDHDSYQWQVVSRGIQVALVLGTLSAVLLKDYRRLLLV